MSIITASVGVHCPNKRSDVLVIQRLLNSKITLLPGSIKLAEDGVCGARTIDTIRRFQQLAVGMSSPDGHIDPNGQTLRILSSGSILGIPIAGGPTTSIMITGVTLPDPARNILREILSSANLTSAKVTSGSRSAHDQARVMYENIKSHGVASQQALYGKNGDAVIDVYVANSTKTQETVIGLMKAKIIALGPSSVSKHCSDTHYTFDVAPSSISNAQKFVAAIKAHPSVSKLIEPPLDPAFHIEIPKSSANNT